MTDQPTLPTESQPAEQPVVTPAQPTESPVFDFDDISWGDTREITRLYARINKAEEARDAETVDSAFNDVQAYLAKCVVSVPRSWLVKRAPDGLDWSKAESFDWLKNRKVVALSKAMFVQMNQDDSVENPN